MILQSKIPFLVDDLTAEQRGRFICAFGGGGGGGTATSQETRPVPYDTNLANQAIYQTWGLYNDPSRWAQYYPGQTVAPMTDAQNQAIQGTIDRASAGSPVTAPTEDFVKTLEGGGYLYGNPAMQALAPFASGQFNDPTTNPAFADTITQLTAKTLPGVVSQFVTGGNLNNPAMTYAAGQGVTDATAPYLSQLYNQGLDRQMQAIQAQGGLYNTGLQQMLTGAQLAPSVQGLGYNDLAQLYGAGALQQQQNQSSINADMARWNYNQAQPMNMINWLNGVAFGQPMGSITTGLSGPSGGGSTANQVMQGIGTAASIAAIY